MRLKTDTPKIEELGQKIQKTSLAELAEVIRGLQVGDESRGSCASQSCMVEHFITMGAAQARQQLAFVQGEVNRVYGGQHQPAPATPVHVREEGEGGDENEEEQRRRAASQQMCQPAQERRNEGFVLALPSLRGMQVKATVTSLIHQEKEEEKEADMFSSIEKQQQQQPHRDGLQ